MLRTVVLVVLVSACGARPSTAPCTPTEPAAHAGTHTIDWPTSLDHVSTPETQKAAALALLDASGMQNTMDRLIDVNLDAQLKAQPMLVQYREQMRAFLRRYLSYEALREPLAQAYAERFSELQLLQITAFYGTPTGKLALTLLPDLVRVGSDLGRKSVEAHQAELIEMIQNAHQQTGPN